MDYYNVMKPKRPYRKRLISHELIQKLRKPLVTEHMYHDIFVTEFNIHFGYRRSDSCSTCDSLTVQIEASTELERPELQKNLYEHQQLAQEGYDTFRYDRELSMTSWADQGSRTKAPVQS